MGWIIYDNPMPYGFSADAYLREYMQFDKDGHSCVIRASTFVGKTWYAAAEINRPASEHIQANKFTVALVILTCGRGTKNRPGRFGYKDMDETMGPCEADCPLYILDMLTPVDRLPDPSYAAQWRQTCRDNAVKRSARRKFVKNLKPGTRIKLAEPVTFYKGAVTIQEFNVVDTSRYWNKKPRGVTLTPADGRSGFYHVRSSMLMGATIIDPS